MTDILRRFRRDTRGATALEYGLILALLVIASMVALMGMAEETTGMWNRVAAEVMKH
jgi:pilus assembly protein Flp/PilA